MTLQTTLVAAAIALTPAIASAQDWTGSYAGIAAGGALIDVDKLADLEGDGTSVGFFAGYNYDTGGIVYGAEFDFDVTDYSIPDAGATVDAVARIKARVGLPVGPGLAYGTAGVVGASSDQLDDGVGYLYGIGYDMPVTENAFIGTELMGHQFEDDVLKVGVSTLKVRAGFSF